MSKKPEIPADFTPLTQDQRDALLCDAQDILSHASSQAEFIQSITLLGDRGKALELNSGQVAGLYYSIQDLIDRIEKVGRLIDEARS